MEQRTGRRLASGIAVVLAVAVVIGYFQFPLVPTLGIVTVGFGLVLPPRQTAVVALVAVAAAAVILLTVDLEYEALRFLNASLAAALAVGVSWTIQQRVQAIARMQATQDALFANVPDGLAVLDAGGKLAQVNEGLRVLIPEVRLGDALHPQLGHVLADGTECPGGCGLDAGAAPTSVPRQGEWITGPGGLVPVEYTTGEVAAGTIVSLRDVGVLQEEAENRRVLLEAAVRQGEQEALLKTLGAPAYAHLPRIPGVELDLFSSHSDTGWAGGADLVHVSPMADGRILVSVVDALEQGVMSVRDAWKVHYVSQSYLMSGTSMSDVVRRTADTLSSEPEPPNASLLIAVLDPGTGMVRVVGGGHPPALLVRSTGASEWLEVDGAGIGFGDGRPQPVHERQLLPGDSLILYTDGLIDAGDDVIQALSTLRASASALRLREPAGWARSLAEAVRASDQASGSATVLLLRYTGGSGNLQTTASR